MDHISKSAAPVSPPLQPIAMQSPVEPPAATRLVDSVLDAGTPPGFIAFCLRTPDQCPEQNGPARSIILDARSWRAIDAANSMVNAALIPVDDMRHYGRAEYWTIPTDGYGDCEDYALMKRKALMAAGMPASALRVAIVIAPRRGRHAVLTVTTDKGDYVLDNLRDDIVPWERAGFIWIARQDSARPMNWALLESAPRQLADAGGIATATNEPVSVAVSGGE